MTKLHVGRKVFLKPIGEYASQIFKGSILEGVKERKVSKIGRKYFYVESKINRQVLKFNLDDFFESTQGCPRWQVYFSMEEVIKSIADESDTNRINRKINDSVRYGRINLNVDQLRRIEKIIDEGDQNEI